MLPREEIWKRFAEEIGATYFPGDFWKPESITAQVGFWTVTLALHHDHSIFSKVTCTRLRATYVRGDDLIFSIFRAEAFQDTGHLSNMPEIVVGEPVFDEAFRVAGNSPSKVHSLLANAALRSYLLEEPLIGLEATLFPDSTEIHLLTCQVIGAVEQPSRLLHLFELMGETLQHLAALGSARQISTILGP